MEENSPGGGTKDDQPDLDFDELKRAWFQRLQDSDGNFPGRLTVNAVAVRAGMNQQTLHRKLSGSGGPIKDNELMALCRVLDIPVYKVLSDIGLIPAMVPLEDGPVSIETMVELLKRAGLEAAWEHVLESTLREGFRQGQKKHKGRGIGR